MLRHLLPTLLALAALCSACRGDVEATAFADISEDGWDAADTLTFSIDSVSRGGTYQLVISLRLTADRTYPFTAVALNVRREWPDTVQTTTTEFPLTGGQRETDGKGIGCILYDFPVDTVSLSTGASGRISISHAMSLDPLPGIRDAGFTLRRIADH